MAWATLAHQVSAGVGVPDEEWRAGSRHPAGVLPGGLAGHGLFGAGVERFVGVTTSAVHRSAVSEAVSEGRRYQKRFRTYVPHDDANGTRVGTGGSFARTLVPAGVPAATYDQANQQLTFGGTTQTFDNNGNLLTQTDPSGTITYTWDARNRLAAMSGPAVSASFAYDALGRRISKHVLSEVEGTINGVTTTYQYDGLDIVRESGGAGEVKYLRTLAIDEALARTDTSGTTAYLTDILGSTLALTDPAGAPLTTYTYAPFGETSASGLPSSNPFQFTGRENDSGRFYYYRARYHDPLRSRFVSEDPLGPIGEGNLYAYVANNPVNAIDSLGLWGFGILGSESIEAGLIAIGAGQTGSIGGGVLLKDSSKI